MFPWQNDIEQFITTAVKETNPPDFLLRKTTVVLLFAISIFTLYDKATTEKSATTVKWVHIASKTLLPRGNTDDS